MPTLNELKTQIQGFINVNEHLKNINVERLNITYKEGVLDIKVVAETPIESIAVNFMVLPAKIIKKNK